MAIAADNRSYKGGCYALDNLYDSDSTLAVRNSYFLYNGWPDPYFAGDCDYCGARAPYSRPKGTVARYIPCQKK